MNKAAIKAELRRSAREDEEPFWECHASAWAATTDFESVGSGLMYDTTPKDDIRTFYLFCAEAL